MEHIVVFQASKKSTLSYQSKLSKQIGKLTHIVLIDGRKIMNCTPAFNLKRNDVIKVN